MVRGLMPQIYTTAAPIRAWGRATRQGTPAGWPLSARLARCPTSPRSSLDRTDSGRSALAAGTRPHAPFRSLAAGTCSAQLGENLRTAERMKGWPIRRSMPQGGTQLSFDPDEEIVYGFARDLSGKRAIKVVPSSSDDCTSIVPPCAVTISFAI